MAVYTQVSDEALAGFLAEYDLGEALAFKGIAEGVENSNFLLTTTKGQFIVTLYEKRVDPRDLPFFLGLLDHLAARGINCPKPIHGRDGQAIRALAGKPAAVTTFLHGLWPRRIGAQHCAPIGRALAELHLAGRDFAIKRPNALSVAGWRPLFDGSRAHADDVAPGLARELGAEIDFFEANWPRDLPAGVIHADLFPDNALFIGERPQHCGGVDRPVERDSAMTALRPDDLAPEGRRLGERNAERFADGGRDISGEHQPLVGYIAHAPQADIVRTLHTRNPVHRPIAFRSAPIALGAIFDIIDAPCTRCTAMAAALHLALPSWVRVPSKAEPRTTAGLRARR